MERDFDLSYSLRMVSEENVKRQLEEIKQKVVLDDNTRILIYVKNAELHVLSHLKPIIAEICECLICKCNQAAITLTNHLFENTLKQTLIIWDSQGRSFSNNQLIEDTFKEEVEKYDDNNIEPNINLCRNKGIITKEEASQLKMLKNKFRDPMSHASYTKLFTNAQMPIWRTSLGNPKSLKEEIVNISMVPIFATFAQVEFAKINAERYFLEIYAMVNNLDKKLLYLYPETKEFVENQRRNNN